MARRHRAAMLATLAAVLVAQSSVAQSSAAGGTPYGGGAASVVAVGAVSAEGLPEPNGGHGPGAAWSVQRTSTGRYLVRLDTAASTTSAARSPSLELTAWDATARVTLTPVSGDAVAVAFDAGGRPVDTRFTFTLVRAGPDS